MRLSPKSISYMFVSDGVLSSDDSDRQGTLQPQSHLIEPVEVSDQALVVFVQVLTGKTRPIHLTKKTSMF